MILHFLTEFFYQNSYLSLCIKRHPSQWVGNLFKINLISVCHNLVESAEAPVCNQLSHSECKPMCEYLFHSFCHGWTCFLENWFIHFAIYTETNKFDSLILMVLCYIMATCHNYILFRLVCKFLWETGSASCFNICEIIDWYSPNFLKKGVCFRRSWHYWQMFA